MCGASPHIFLYAGARLPQILPPICSLFSSSPFGDDLKQRFEETQNASRSHIIRLTQNARVHAGYLDGRRHSRILAAAATLVNRRNKTEAQRKYWPFALNSLLHVTHEYNRRRSLFCVFRFFDRLFTPRAHANAKNQIKNLQS